MQVMTVLGPIPTDQLGITLPHEHLFLDLVLELLPDRTDFDIELTFGSGGRIGRQNSADRLDLANDFLAEAGDLVLESMTVFRFWRIAHTTLILPVRGGGSSQRR